MNSRRVVFITPLAYLMAVATVVIGIFAFGFGMLWLGNITEKQNAEDNAARRAQADRMFADEAVPLTEVACGGDFALAPGEYELFVRLPVEVVDPIIKEPDRMGSHWVALSPSGTEDQLDTSRNVAQGVSVWSDPKYRVLTEGRFTMPSGHDHISVGCDAVWADGVEFLIGPPLPAPQ